MELADPELSVVLTDNEHIHQLNLQWRAEDKPTDVLSFPLHEPDVPGRFDTDIFALGDVVISVEYAEQLVETKEHQARVARELQVSPEELSWHLTDEVHFLLIHGLLHLVGYDHATPEEEREMKAQEKRLWQASQQP
ncbi:MAG: rRNA maturation RNase YbeY [Persicimonas sp.]